MYLLKQHKIQSIPALMSWAYAIFPYIPHKKVVKIEIRSGPE